MSTRRSMTRSPMALARMALRVAKDALPAYSNINSPRKYTQHQLFAILVLRKFFRTDYRGIIAMLDEWSDLRNALELERMPHYSTLCYAEQRLLKKGLSIASLPAFSAWLERAA